MSIFSVLKDIWTEEKQKKADLTEEFKSMLLAAQNANPYAQYRVSLMYYLGKGTGMSMENHLFWLACACLNGYSKAIESFEHVYDVPKCNLVHDNFLKVICVDVIQNYPQYIPYYRGTSYFERLF